MANLVTSYKTAFYPETAIGGFTGVDSHVAFYARVNALIQPSYSVLDFGCGRGKQAEEPVSYRRQLSCVKGKVAKVIGIDVDPVGAGNPFLDEFRLVLPDRPWPVDTRSVDLIICDSVLEHLSDPPAFFREARRVLVPGGYLCLVTPNVLSYVGLISRIVPNKYHAAVTARVQPGRQEKDVFPTYYRCNTPFALRRQMKAHGFRAVVYGYEGEPRYLEFSKFAYALGVFHQRLAPGFLRPCIFGFAQLE
jgi:SAM-dependent methyltransferase